VPENITQTIRNLEALAARPGTFEEGELAKAKAIELSTKHGVPSIYTQPNYTPPTKFKPIPKPTKLHHKVVAMEEKLKEENWLYSHFNGKRVYMAAGRPDEEIHMFAYRFGEFTCQHYYKLTGKLRQAGNNPRELDNFFASVSYRYQLWPTLQHDRPITPDDFYTPGPEQEAEEEKIVKNAVPEEEQADVIEDLLQPKPKPKMTAKQLKDWKSNLF
jgi:hypothetical protein